MMLPPNLLAIKGAAVKLAIELLILIAVGLAAYAHGRHVAEGEKAQAERDIAIAYAKEIVKQQEVADKLAIDNAKLRDDQAPKDRLITREIARYVQTPPDHRFPLPGRWRLLHDAAATGTPGTTEAGSLADAPTDPVEDTTAIETIGDNYTACRESIAKLIAWQNRYRRLEEGHEETR